VEDTGSGVPAEIEERIFEPYFSTKPPTKGTGLGLPVVRQIAQSHGGSVELNNVRGRGARFTVILPQAEEE
jgi:signal transduction histidine kinase